MSILIIGGGVIGLSIGWQLARQQMDVHIFEKGEAGKEASWAAAGMLAPYSEINFGDDCHLDLGQTSLFLYPQFLQELNEDANLSLSFEASGTLHVGMDKDDRIYLERLFHNLKRRNVNVEWLSGKEAQKMEPFISSRASSAIWIPDETHINNKVLLDALKKAFKNCGGNLHENSHVNRLWIQGQCLKGIWTDQPIAGKSVVNCAGAWADAIHTSSIPILPNKGQIITLTMYEKRSLTYMIRTPRVYLVPKSNGSLRVGATSEETGFNKIVTAGGVLGLLQAAYEVVPEIDQMSFLEVEAGLRPVSFDRQPCIGETSLKGYFQAYGHGRAGILLAPYTAYKMVEKLCKSK